jgi:hypothetical protein
VYEVGPENRVERFMAGAGQRMFGSALAVVGDIDGDGVSDVAVASPGCRSGLTCEAGSDECREATSVAFVSGASRTILSRATSPGPHAGPVDLCAVGDTDGDGLLECVIGWAGAGQIQRVSCRDATLLQSWQSPASWDAFCGGTDVTGDATPDVLVSGSGLVVAYSGADGSEVGRVVGDRNEDFGGSITLAGDRNSDDITDVIIGSAMRSATGQCSGAVWVYSFAAGP